MDFYFVLHTSRGADLKALVREAAIAALKDHMQLHSAAHWLTPDQSGRSEPPSPVATRKLGGVSEGSEVDVSACVVTMQHFVSALKRVRPSVSGKVYIICILWHLFSYHNNKVVCDFFHKIK